MDARHSACPRCGERGRAVVATTVEHLVAAQSARSFPDGAMFCAAPSCDVVYFDGRGRFVDKRALRVAVFQKETDPSRPVCYCFGHTVANVLAAASPDGSNQIEDSIKAECRAARDRCEETNPQGRCCLGNVRAVAKGAVARGARPPCCEGTG